MSFNCLKHYSKIPSFQIFQLVKILFLLNFKLRKLTDSEFVSTFWMKKINFCTQIGKLWLMLKFLSKYDLRVCLSIIHPRFQLIVMYFLILDLITVKYHIHSQVPSRSFLGAKCAANCFFFHLGVPPICFPLPVDVPQSKKSWEPLG